MAELESFREMLDRGVLSPEHRELADRVFAEESFTLLVLHAHLLVEKALNEHLLKAGLPSVLLGPEGLEFQHKCKAYLQLKYGKHTSASLFSVLGRLRNNVAHDFWNDGDCVKDAFKIFITGKKNRTMLEQVASTPRDSVKLLFLMLAAELKIFVTKARPAGEAGV